MWQQLEQVEYAGKEFFVNLYECPGYYYTGNPKSSRKQSENAAVAMSYAYEAKLALRVRVKLKPPYAYNFVRGLFKVEI